VPLLYMRQEHTTSTLVIIKDIRFALLQQLAQRLETASTKLASSDTTHGYTGQLILGEDDMIR
jgi:hypothetical protein